MGTGILWAWHQGESENYQGHSEQWGITKATSLMSRIIQEGGSQGKSASEGIWTRLGTRLWDFESQHDRKIIPTLYNSKPPQVSKSNIQSEKKIKKILFLTTESLTLLRPEKNKTHSYSFHMLESNAGRIRKQSEIKSTFDES